MNEVMQNILLLSAVGSVLALVLLCIKPLTKRLFSPKWQYYIWLTVLIVMVLPVKLSLPAEPVQILPIENTSAQTQQTTPVQAQQESAQPAALEEIAQRPVLRISDIPNGIVRLSGFLWLAVAALLLGYRMTKYIMFLRTIKKHSVPEFGLESIPKRLTVRKTELLDAPLIVGLIKPVLYLPQTEIKEDELDYILLHELTHYRRHDLLYKWFSMLVSSIHWFNPFVYIVSRQIDEECEVSCDYEVCKTLTEPQKKNYMAMILDFVQTSIRKKRPLTTQMASSKKILKRRFLMMKTKKATSKFISVLSVVLALTILSTTVFASGFANAYFNTKEKVEVFIDGSGLTDFYENTPFLENNTPYLPLRETFRIFVFDENILSWGFDNDYKTNYVQINIPQNFTNRDSALDCRVYINRNNVIVGGISYFLQTPTILKNDITYVPYEFFQLIVAAQPLDGSSRLFDNLYIYDKNGNEIGKSDQVMEWNWNPKPEIFNYASEFLKSNIENSLSDIGVTEPYTYDILSHRNFDNNEVEFYVAVTLQNGTVNDLLMKFRPLDDGSWLRYDTSYIEY